jgi:hypothetical protein
MSRRFPRLAMAALVAGNLLLAAAAQQFHNYDGRVFEAASHRGIENLEVKLTPPTSSNLPVRLANTDQNGEFHFVQVKLGRYLLEVSQGPDLLYRAEIETGTQERIEIPLQRR